MDSSKLDSKANDSELFYQSSGIRIGFIPTTAGNLESECFRNYYKKRESFTAEQAVAACSDHCGLLPDMTIMILDILGIPRAKQFFFPRKGKHYGVLTNGSWSGVTAELVDGEYDTSFPIFTPLTERLNVIDFSVPLWTFPAVLTTRWPEDTGGIHVNPLSVLSMSSWAALLTVGTLLASILVLEQTLFSNQMKKVGTALFHIFDRSVQSVLLFTGFSLTLSSSKGSRVPINFPRVTLGLWALAAAVIAGLYSGSILVKIVQQKVSLPFHDIATLAACIKANKCYVFMIVKASNYRRLMNSESLSSEEMLLRKAVQNNPIKFTSTTTVSEEIFNSESDKYAVLFTVRTVLNSILTNDRKYSSHEYYDINEGYSEPWCFPTRKSSNLTALLSKAVNKARETGLLDAVYSKYFGSNTEMGTKLSINKRPKPVTTAMLSGTLTILISGIGIGLMVFAVEKMFLLNRCNASYKFDSQMLNSGRFRGRTRSL